MTGVSLPMDRFLREAPARIPSLAGIKYSNPDLVMYRRCLDIAGRRLDLPWGTDEALLAALATGARGAVGSTYNWAPRLVHRLIDAFQRGDLAEARQLQSVAVAMVARDLGARLHGRLEGAHGAPGRTGRDGEAAADESRPQSKWMR